MEATRLPEDASKCVAAETGSGPLAALERPKTSAVVPTTVTEPRVRSPPTNREAGCPGGNVLKPLGKCSDCEAESTWEEEEEEEGDDGTAEATPRSGDEDTRTSLW